MKLALFEPEIPPNTGNIARLCAAFEVELNLIEPLGFSLDNRYLKRAGLDYWPHVSLRVWPSLPAFQKSIPAAARIVMASTHGETFLQNFQFKQDDVILLGPETRGLPAEVLASSPWRLRIPSRSMDQGGVRSLNLATAAGIFLFTALNNCGMLKNLD